MKGLAYWLKNLWNDEDGLGTLEILLIIAVLVVVALIFKEKIVEWVGELFTKSKSEADKLYE